MKRLLLIVLTFVTLSSWAKKTRIEISEDRDVSTAELRRRIRSLQEAVIDLQARVDQLESKTGVTSVSGTLSSQGPTPTVTCYIETPFDGLFDATESNETKARVEAIKSCMNKVKSRIHCSADKVKCGN